jgi:hypothetical protein
LIAEELPNKSIWFRYLIVEFDATDQCLVGLEKVLSSFRGYEHLNPKGTIAERRVVSSTREARHPINFLRWTLKVDSNAPLQGNRFRMDTVLREI